MLVSFAFQNALGHVFFTLLFASKRFNDTLGCTLQLFRINDAETLTRLSEQLPVPKEGMKGFRGSAAKMRVKRRTLWNFFADNSHSMFVYACRLGNNRWSKVLRTAHRTAAL